MAVTIASLSIQNDAKRWTRLDLEWTAEFKKEKVLYILHDEKDISNYYGHTSASIYEEMIMVAQNKGVITSDWIEKISKLPIAKWLMELIPKQLNLFKKDQPLPLDIQILMMFHIMLSRRTKIFNMTIHRFGIFIIHSKWTIEQRIVTLFRLYQMATSTKLYVGRISNHWDKKSSDEKLSTKSLAICTPYLISSGLPNDQLLPVLGERIALKDKLDWKEWHVAVQNSFPSQLTKQVWNEKIFSPQVQKTLMVLQQRVTSGKVEIVETIDEWVGYLHNWNWFLSCVCFPNDKEDNDTVSCFLDSFSKKTKHVPLELLSSWLQLGTFYSIVQARRCVFAAISILCKL